ncbi:TPA: hypothetical protein ACWV7H_004671 [Salmonella enterica subsp. enterica serovar Muenchen]
MSAGTGRGYRPAEREYPATITPVVAVIQDGVSVASPCVFDRQLLYSLYTGRLTPSGSFRGSQNPAWQEGGLLRLDSRNAL